MSSALRENRLASQLTETIPITDPIHYAMRKESVSSVAQLQRAIEADRAGDYETAEALYEDLVRIRPDDPNIRARFGDNLARQSKLGPAKEQYEAALAVDPQLGSAHYGLGTMLNFEGDYDGAAGHYRAALESMPDDARTMLNLAGILAFQGELREAASLCRRALEIDPKGFAPNFHLGRVLIQQNLNRDAIPFLRAAIEARPDSGPAHRQLSIALVGIGDYASAWTHVERAQELGEKIPSSLVEELRRRVRGY
jgi:Tfp pilus assembly protein PilF